MKIIQKISYKSADFLTSQLQQNHVKRYEYYFGFQMIYQSILKVLIIVLLALILGTLRSVVFIVLSFTTLRFFAGGVHMGTYFKCFSITLITFLPASLVCEYFSSYILQNYIGLIIILVIFFISLLSIYLYAPKDSPMNQVSANRASTLKALSFTVLLLWTIVLLWLYFSGRIESAMSIGLGILLEVSSIIPMGVIFYTKLNKIGAKHD